MKAAPRKTDAKRANKRPVAKALTSCPKGVFAWCKRAKRRRLEAIADGLRRGGTCTKAGMVGPGFRNRLGVIVADAHSQRRNKKRIAQLKMLAKQVIAGSGILSRRLSQALSAFFPVKR